MKRAVVLLAACSAPQQTKPSSVAICDESWEPNACLDAGHYYESRGDNPRAAEMFDRGCKRNLFDACIAGSKHSPEIAVTACERGYEPACMNAAIYFDRDVAKSFALLDRICQREPARCGEAARIMVDRDEPSALALVRHACSVGERAACTAGVQLPFRVEAHRLELGRLGCAIDLAESCFIAASNTTPQDQRELLTRACTLKYEPACVQLGQLISR